MMKHFPFPQPYFEL